MGRRVAVFGGSVALVLVAVGCGSGAPSAAPKSNSDVLQVIQAAASTTGQQSSMQVRGTMSMDLGALDNSGTGAVDAAFEGTFQTRPLAARIDFSQMQVAGRSLGSGISELVTPDAFYMKMPMLSAQFGGKPWLEIRFDDMKALSGLDVKSLLSQAQQMQPGQYVEQLAAAGDIREIGKETVNGVATTHYAGSVPLDTLLAKYSPQLRAQMAPKMQQAGFTGASIDVWVDAQGLVRRIRSTTQGGRGTVAISMDVLAYGVHVDVTPPPASQVTDAGALARQAGGTGG